MSEPTPAGAEAVSTEPATGAAIAAAGIGYPEVITIRQGSFGVSGSGDTSGFGGLVEVVALPPATPRPYGGWFDDVSDELELALPARGVPAEAAIERVVIEHGEITYFVRREHLRAFATVLRDELALRFELCCGVSGMHYPEDVGRESHAVYHFRSITHNRQVRVEVVCPDGDSHIPSIVPVYPTADWHERETYDFFGIVFDGHPALTRIMMPDDWDGHPQRKDYPLNGVHVQFKGATIPPPDLRRAYN